VEFRDVSFRYGKGGENALSNVSFSVLPGQTVGIIGGTGSGKSTLVNLLCRFYEAGEGTVFVDGRNVDSYPSEELLSKIGIVPQKATLFRGTVRSNMAFGKEDVTDDEIWEALEAAQAKDFVEQNEAGLDATVEQFGRNLSGGQRQRLTIARALVRKPQILILDDSSSALDYATDLALRRAIRSLAYQPTVFLVTQRASTLKGADLIVVLEEGEAVGLGTHDALYESCEVYREICDSQTKRS
jgi:ABC-type multidrug transport system fused ATPase/permease subunit